MAADVLLHFTVSDSARCLTASLQSQNRVWPLVYAVQDCSKFDAYGRIISGTLRPGDRVRVLGEAYTPDDEEDSGVEEVTGLWAYQARYRWAGSTLGSAQPCFCACDGMACQNAAAAVYSYSGGVASCVLFSVFA